jgi:hypothetical protein
MHKIIVSNVPIKDTLVKKMHVNTSTRMCDSIKEDYHDFMEKSYNISSNEIRL